MTEGEYLPLIMLAIAAVAGLATVALVAFFWWAEREDRAPPDPYVEWDSDKIIDGSTSEGWTIQITYGTRTDDGKIVQARSAYWSDAPNLAAAYAEARDAFEGQNVRFGACLPGKHVRVP